MKRRSKSRLFEGLPVLDATDDLTISGFKRKVVPVAEIMETYFDRQTLAHLDKWLDHTVNGDDCRAEVRQTMLAFAADDPEYWSGQSWPNLFDRAKCDDIVRKHDRYVPTPLFNE